MVLPASRTGHWQPALVSYLDAARTAAIVVNNDCSACTPAFSSGASVSAVHTLLRGVTWPESGLLLPPRGMATIDQLDLVVTASRELDGYKAASDTCCQNGRTKVCTRW